MKLWQRARCRDPLLWASALVATLLVAGVIPLLFDSRFYYSGDIQVAYLGWWWELGNQLRDGRWPLLDVQSWRAGNVVAEGQWGLFSPLTIAIGIAASLTANVVVFTTSVVIGLVVVLGLGVFCLVRSYNVPAPAAYVAGVVAPLCGQAQYADWGSWVNGLMVTSLLPWAWWTVRRVIVSQSNPFPALLACYLVVTVGYVYGTLYLAAVFGGCLLEAALARNRAGLVRGLLVGVCSALVAVAVYLPGILTSPVTIRGAWDFVGAGKWTVDLDTLFTSVLPTGLVQAETSDGIVGRLVPYRYLAWVLPMIAWVDFGRLRGHVRETAGLLAVSAVMLVWVLAPETMGPIRWPVRVLPALALPVVVLVVVLLARTVRVAPSAPRLALSLGWVALAWWVVTARMGDVTVAGAVGAALVAAGLALTWVAVRLQLLRAAAVVVAAFSLVVMLFQHVYYPESPSPDRNLPASAADYRGQLATSVGDTMTVGYAGRSWRTVPDTSEEILIGSTWYLNQRPVHNTGTAISFRAYFLKFCMNWSGTTCPEALKRLFRREPTTGAVWADLMSVSTVLLHRQSYPGMRLREPPEGWHISELGRQSITWVRDEPLPTAGGVVWTSSGTQVSGVSSSDRQVSFQVDDVPDEGGRVVLSRLPWPGYRADGASLGEPLADMLLTVDVPPGADGRVTVRFTPPGWRMVLLCWWLGVGLAVLWSAAHLALRSRRGSGGARSAHQVPG